MQSLPARDPRLLLRVPPLVLLATLTGCVYETHHGGHHGQGGIPVYGETEPNDFASEAEPFGLLRPGDGFAIAGHVRDDEFDPADGFAFTAAQPLHVEFRLVAENPYADLAVALYDPFLDETVAVFQTGNNPELGSVDVFAGDVDFHLVVASLAGFSDYRLELQVFSLGLAAREAPEEGGARLRPAGASLATEAVASPPGLEGYPGREEPAPDAPESAAAVGFLIEVDAAEGTITRSPLVLNTDGTWMGIPGGVLE